MLRLWQGIASMTWKCNPTLTSMLADFGDHGLSMSFAYESVWSRARLPAGEVSIVTGEDIRARKEEARGSEGVKRRA